MKSGRLKTILSKKLTKEHHAVNYIDEILIVLSAACGGVCIISSASVVGLQLEQQKFYCNLFLNHRNNKYITEYNQKQNEKTR